MTVGALLLCSVMYFMPFAASGSAGSGHHYLVDCLLFALFSLRIVIKALFREGWRVSRNRMVRWRDVFGRRWERRYTSACFKLRERCDWKGSPFWGLFINQTPSAADADPTNDTIVFSHGQPDQILALAEGLCAITGWPLRVE